MLIIYVSGDHEELFELPDGEKFFYPLIRISSEESRKMREGSPKKVKSSPVKIELYRHGRMRKQIKLATTDTLSEQRIEELIYRYGSPAHINTGNY